ncbi:hypothetical protein PVK06_025393 [Gossypium arboreum]|uniref:Uncharacterized protein n=1 Tax=Gossypium arboreum TaxID=29729 RepID=A0ABR0PGG1_GOSAR|nr:hypothetical protein PVK06_025393 [Gossypium arboreum]
MAATIKAIKAILDQKLKESQLIENQIKGLEEALKDLGGSAVDLPSPAEVATQSTTTTPLCSSSLVIPSHFDWHEYGLGYSCVPHIQCPHSLRHGHVTWPCVPQSHFDWHEHGLDIPIRDNIEISLEWDILEWNKYDKKLQILNCNKKVHDILGIAYFERVYDRDKTGARIRKRINKRIRKRINYSRAIKNLYMISLEASASFYQEVYPQPYQEVLNFIHHKHKNKRPHANLKGHHLHLHHLLQPYFIN